MLDTIFWIVVGMFLGWQFPQPPWAAFIQAKIIAKLKSLTK